MDSVKTGFMQKPTAVRIKKAAAILLVLATLALIVSSVVRILRTVEVTASKDVHFIRTTEALEEEYEDETVCPVEYESADGEYLCTVNYSFEEWEALPSGHGLDGKVYLLSDGRYAAFSHEADQAQIDAAIHDMNADLNRAELGTALALGLMAVSLLVMVFFGKYLTDYEQIWFLSIMILAAVISILVPEEDVNGIKGI